MKPYTPSITAFLVGHANNAWLTGRAMSVYVRKAEHIVEGKLGSCFDIANIEVKERQRGKGLFTEWLAGVESEVAAVGIDYVYHENTFNERLFSFLLKHGYTEISSNPPCSYKRVRGAG
jgi:GNAT superfamily N-acetyltransferase